MCEPEVRSSQGEKCFSPRKATVRGQEGQLNKTQQDEGQAGADVQTCLEFVRTNSPRWLADLTRRTSAIEREIVNCWGQAFGRFDLLVIAVQRALELSDKTFILSRQHDTM